MTFPPPGPYPSSPYGAAPVGTPKNHRNRTLLLTAVVAILALLLTTGVVIFWKARNGEINIPGITLQSAEEPGNDPFTPSVALTNKPLNENVKLASNNGAQDNGVRVVSGTQPGLYAADAGTCDAAALGNYLANNPSAGAAWASVFGIDRASIPYYLNTLTPVILTADTWVTNHSYTGGSAYAFQSVLQAGTAVMVDGAGVPRVRCSCGNPLAPPAAAPIGGYRIRGAHWHDYHTHNITRVAYNTQNVTVVNNTTTVVQQAAPTVAANQATLSLVPVDGGQLIDRIVGNILDLSGQAPLAEELPNPVSANAAYVASTDEDAQRQGLARAGSTDVADEVVVAAQENNGVPEGAPETETAAAKSAAAAPDAAGQEGRVAAAESTASDSAASGETSAAASSASSASSAAPTPTRFSGSGDSIGSFTFDKDGTAVSCRAPSVESLTGSVALTCSDSVSRSISQSSLGESAVTSATDSDGVWTVSPTDASGSTTPVEVTSASWQTLTPATTTTTTTPTVETPAETAETTVETTTPETTTEVPTVEPPTETEEATPSG